MNRWKEKRSKPEKKNYNISSNNFTYIISFIIVVFIDFLLLLCNRFSVIQMIISRLTEQTPIRPAIQTFLPYSSNLICILIEIFG